MGSPVHKLQPAYLAVKCDFWLAKSENATTNFSHRLRVLQMAEEACEAPVAGKKRELKKFMFSREQKYELLKCVRVENAHRAAHGVKEKAFNAVCERFFETWVHTHKPIGKTMQDKFREMVRSRKKANAANQRASGQPEELSQAELLLNDLMLEQDDFDEEHRGKRNELKATDEALLHAGQRVQQQALKRGMRDSVSPRPKKKQKKNEDDMFEDWCAQVKVEMADMKKSREEDITLRKREIELNEKRFEEDKKDREANRAQQQATLNLLNVLTDKLTK